MMKREEGFTLLEVIVAMTILAAGIVAVFGFFSGSLRLSAGSRDASDATIYASQRIEEALMAPNPVEGKEHGYFGDKFRWELSTSIVLHEPEAGEEDRQAVGGEERDGEKPQAYEEIRITVTIYWTEGEDELSTDVSAARWRLAKKDEKA